MKKGRQARHRIPRNSCLILCYHCTIVTTKKELKNSVIVMWINSNLKNANFTFFSNCRKNEDFTKFQQQIFKKKKKKKKLVTDITNISTLL